MKFEMKLIEIKYKYIITKKFYSWSNIWYRKLKEYRMNESKSTFVDWELRFERVILVLELKLRAVDIRMQ